MSLVARTIAIGGVLGVAATLLIAPAAFASDPIAWTPATQTIEYGQSWVVRGKITTTTYGTCDDCYGTMYVTVDGVSKIMGRHMLAQGSFTIDSYSLLPQIDPGVGTHEISVHFKNAAKQTVASSVTSAKLVVTASALTSTTTVTQDPNNSRNAIVTARLNGKLVDQLADCYCEDAGPYTLPAGTWNIAVTDAQGKTVLTSKKEQAAGGDPFYVYYWLDIPPGETLSAKTTFTATGSTSSNYAVTAGDFSYTSAKSTTLPPTPQAGASKSSALLDQTISFEQPLWRLLLALLIGLMLAALIVVLLVRRRAPKSSTNSDGATL